MDNINERKIKMNGIANIPEDLVNGQTVHLNIRNAEVREVSEEPTDKDGKVNKTFKIRLSEMSKVVVSQGDKILVAKVKGGQSKAMRYAYQLLYEANFQNDSSFIDFEDFYQKRMSEYINIINQEREL